MTTKKLLLVLFCAAICGGVIGCEDTRSSTDEDSDSATSVDSGAGSGSNTNADKYSGNVSISYNDTNTGSDAIQDSDRYANTDAYADSDRVSDFGSDIVTDADTDADTRIAQGCAIEDVQSEPGGTGWMDSYSANGKCYCDTTFDHAIGDYVVDTPAGTQTVREVCEATGPGPGRGKNPIYNDIQCGNGPANDAGDEDWCPGRVDLGKAGCCSIGPKWDLSVFN